MSESYSKISLGNTLEPNKILITYVYNYMTWVVPSLDQALHGHWKPIISHTLRYKRFQYKYVNGYLYFFFHSLTDPRHWEWV